MAAWTDWGEAAILNGLVRSAALLRPTNWYLGLFTTAPSDAGPGAEISTTGTAYARQPLAVANTTWTAASVSGDVTQILNAGSVAFAAPTADWGTPTHAGLFDAVTAGNLFCHAAIGGTPRTVLNGDPAFSIAPNAFALSVGGMFSTYLRTALLNHLFRGTALVAPTNLFAALHTADPTIAGTGAEVTGGGYARVAIAANDTSWTAPAASGTDSRVQTAAVIAFPSPTANWGTPTHWALRDALTAGNQWFHAANVPPDGSAPRAILAGDNPPQFGVGALSLQVG